MANITIKLNCGVAASGTTYDIVDTVTGTGAPMKMRLKIVNGSQSWSDDVTVSKTVGRYGSSAGHYYPKDTDMQQYTWSYTGVNLQNPGSYIHLQMSDQTNDTSTFVWDKTSLSITIDGTEYKTNGTYTGAPRYTIDGSDDMFIGTQSTSDTPIAIKWYMYVLGSWLNSQSWRNDFILIKASKIPQGYTITYKGVNGETIHTDTNQTQLPSSAPSGSSKGIVSPQTISGLTYRFDNSSASSRWVLPSGKSWGDTITSNVTIKSNWKIDSYTSSKTATGSTYKANFVGYNSTFTVTTTESIKTTATYTISGVYVGGNTKPNKQSLSSAATHHITQKVGKPKRIGGFTSKWTYSSISYANGDTKSFTDPDGNVTDPAGSLKQTYTKSSVLTVSVPTPTGNESTNRYLSYYDSTSSRRSHMLESWSNGTEITGSGTSKSYWHAPQVWKYRVSGDGAKDIENKPTNTGWYKDVELRKYNRSNNSWQRTNKWKYQNGAWKNCDTDLNINR